MGSVSWITITKDDLYAYLVAAQINALRTAALSTSNPAQGDPFDEIMPDVAKRIRTAIASNPRNILSVTANSVPPECRWMLIWLTLEGMSGRLELGVKLLKTQEKTIADAKEALDEMRNWRKEQKWLVISLPDDPETDPAQSVNPPAYVVKSADRQATRCTLEGL